MKKRCPRKIWRRFDVIGQLAQGFANRGFTYQVKAESDVERNQTEIMIGPDSYPTVVHVRKVRFLTNEFNRYKRGLETFRQANLWQSVHSNFHRVRATSMTQRRVENSLDTLAHFRLYRLKEEIFFQKNEMIIEMGTQQIEMHTHQSEIERIKVRYQGFLSQTFHFKNDF